MTTTTTTTSYSNSRQSFVRTINDVISLLCWRVRPYAVTLILLSSINLEYGVILLHKSKTENPWQLDNKQLEKLSTMVVEVGRVSANAKNAFNSFVGRIFANLRQKRRFFTYYQSLNKKGSFYLGKPPSKKKEFWEKLSQNGDPPVLYLWNPHSDFFPFLRVNFF